MMKKNKNKNVGICMILRHEKIRLKKSNVLTFNNTLRNHNRAYIIVCYNIVIDVQND